MRPLVKNDMFKLRYYIGEVTFFLHCQRYNWFGGTVRSVIKSVDNGTVSEEAFYEGNEIVRYYAYGHYDPSLPYTGQPKVKVI